MVEDLSATSVVPALEANMVAFWVAYGRAPGAELYEGEDLVRVVTGVSEPLFNGVFRTRLAPDAVESAIATTLAHLASRRVSMFWWVGPFTRPPDLGTHLERHGLTRAANLPAMAVDLRTLPEEPPSIPGVVVAPVEDLETLRTWARVAAIGTEFPSRSTKNSSHWRLAWDSSRPNASTPAISPTRTARRWPPRPCSCAPGWPAFSP